MKKYLSRKFLLALAGSIAYYFLEPQGAKEICGLLGLPSLYVVMEGLRDIFGKKTE